MTTQAKEIANRHDTPENYRSPGAAASPSDLSPSTRELLGLLRTFETALAA